MFGRSGVSEGNRKDYSADCVGDDVVGAILGGHFHSERATSNST